MREQEQPIIKSPSDTMIYAPALQKKLTPTRDEGLVYVTQNTQGVHEIIVNDIVHRDNGREVSVPLYNLPSELGAGTLILAYKLWQVQGI